MLRGKQIEKWVCVEGGGKRVKNTWLIPSSAFFLSIKYAFQQEMEQIMDSSDDTNLATF